MSRNGRMPTRPDCEPMERRALMAGGPAMVINPAITVDDTTAGTMEVHILSQAGAHPFEPLRDVLPGTIRIDGIAFRAPRLSADPVDENGDGIPDAVLTVSPRGALALPPVGSAVWVTGVDRFRSAGRPVVWEGVSLVKPGGAGLGLGSLVAAQAYIGTVGLIAPQFLNLNVLAVTPSGGTYGLTPGTGLPLVPGRGARVTAGGVYYFNTGNQSGNHAITLQVPLGTTFTFNNIAFRLSTPGGPIPVYQMIYAGSGNNFTLKLVSG